MMELNSVCAGSSLEKYVAVGKIVWKQSGFNEGLELDLAVDGFDDVFDIAAILFGLQVFGFFADEFIEAGTGELGGFFASLFFGFDERFEELIDFLRFVLISIPLTGETLSISGRCRR